MFDRLNNIRKLFDSGSMVFLFGPGVNDSYLASDLSEIDFRSALSNVLEEAGFMHMVFSTPSKIIDFNNNRHREEFYQPDQTKASAIQFPAMSGPLGDLKIFVHPQQNPQNTIGDVHTLRMFDNYIQQVGPEKKAIIILNAEAWVQFFDDPRILSGFFSKWVNLPSNNPNKIFFIFSATTAENLKTALPGIPVPEIRYFTEKYLLTEHNHIDHLISYPDQDEIQALLLKHDQLFSNTTDPNFIEKLSGWMLNENTSLREWLKRFDGLPEITPEYIQSAGWFEAIRDISSSADSSLENMIGLGEVKKRIQDLKIFYLARKTNGSGQNQAPLLHMVFSGSPGTGKTTVARLIGEIFHDIGLLKRGHLVEASISDLIGEAVGITPSKVKKIIDRAMDGVLFIDEAYMLTESDRGGFGREAIDSLISCMENYRSRLVIIFAGYPDKMEKFIHSNPGLSRRIPEMNRFRFLDLTADELLRVFDTNCDLRNLEFDQEAHQTILSVINYLVDHKDENFGNAGEIRNLVDSLEINVATRENRLGIQTRLVITEDIPENYRNLIGLHPPSPIEILQELEEFEGLDQIQAYLEQLSSRLIVENQRKKVNPDYSGKTPKLNFVFLGNPGTGKTSVARLLGKILMSAGVIKTSRVVEVSRGDLVAGYIGQSAIKTQEVIEKALDGILFIDEAYSLTGTSGLDYSGEVISTLIKAIDQYSNRLIIILAGYPDEMKRFIHSNPGLNSRFPNQISFPDFDTAGLTHILLKRIDQEHFEITNQAAEQLPDRLVEFKFNEGRYFGNARSVLTYFEQIKDRLAHRLLMTYKKADLIPDEELSLITLDDLP
ncbi:MAG: AAA family ATPase [Anaerolineaceae bacterium]|nr:AAA family ATPase [Anaerolineaceae bacterium]